MEPEHNWYLPKQSVFWPGILGVALLAVALHLACINQYGYFRDELYYLACAARLDWGYVDHPPLCVFLLRAVTSVFGTSLAAVRIPSVLAGAATAVTYGMICAHLGGNRIAQILATAFACLAPVYAVVAHLYSMNSLEVLLWALAALCYLRAAEDRRWWLAVGIVCGLALLNKLSAGMLMLGILLATIATPRRKELASAFPYLGALIALALFSPHLFWLAQHDSISLEFIRNAAEHKMVHLPPHLMLGIQVVVTNPAMAILWIAGLWIGIREPKLRMVVIPCALLMAIILLTQRSRENYLAPSYAFCAPIGAIWLERMLRDRAIVRWIFGIAWPPITAFPFSLAIPLLPPVAVEKIAELSPIKPPAVEQGPKSPIQGFADMFGWPQMARSAERVWLSLPSDERSNTPVFGQNYGESSAVWFYRTHPEMKVIGRHNQYWLWGPGDWDGRKMVIVGEVGPEIRECFESVEEVERLDSPYAMPEESRAPISLGYRLKVPVEEFWQRVRKIQ